MRTRTEFDLLASLHKALRSCIFDVLVEVGRVDASDGDALRRTALRVQRLLALLREPPGALHRAVAQLQRGPLAQRADAAHELYQALSHWSIGMLQKLALDEQQQAARPAATPAQRQRQLASLSDAELSEALQWLGRALNPQELAALLADLQQAGDGARFGHALQALGEHLDAARWDQLARAMELPQVTLPERLALAA